MTDTHSSPESARSIILPLLGLVGVIAIFAVLISVFGIAGLMVPYLALVPLIFTVLVWISMGKL